jgi:hypothetical protein
MENTIANIRILDVVRLVQLHQFDIGGKGPIPMFSIQGLGV